MPFREGTLGTRTFDLCSLSTGSSLVRLLQKGTFSYTFPRDLKMNIRQISQILLLLTGISISAMAAAPIPAPEIDPGMGWNAIALLGGLALVIRARCRR